jgi:hypothetical protein
VVVHIKPEDQAVAEMAKPGKRPPNQTQTQQPLSFLETLAVMEPKVPTGLVAVVVVLAELAR